MSDFQGHQAVRIRTGKYAGLVGNVFEQNRDKGTVRVQIQGVQDGQPLNVDHWFKAAQLEAIQ